MRVLFTFAGGAGHFIPLLPIARAMAAAGHEAAFGAQAALLPTVRRHGFQAHDTGGNTFGDESERQPLRRLDMTREIRAIRNGYAGSIARQRALAILALAASWKPDLLVCDEMDFGSMIAAERLSVPYATVLVIASGMLARHHLLAEPLNALRAEYGLSPDPDLAMLSRHLVLSPFPPSLRDPHSPLPSTALSFQPDQTVQDQSPAWIAELPDLPSVYVTLGTVFNVESGDLFVRLLEGVRALSVNVIVTVGPQIDPRELGPQPENVRVERYVSQWALLPHCALVVSHAGSGTVFGALSHGVPMLLLPMGADQPFNAQRCEELGVAGVLDPMDCTPEMVRREAARLLASSAHRQATERIKDEIAALPRQETAMALLYKLAKAHKTSRV